MKLILRKKTHNNMRIKERKQWAQRVLTQLRTKANLQDDEFIFLAGEKYREYLIPHIKRYTVPTYYGTSLVKSYPRSSVERLH